MTPEEVAQRVEAELSHAELRGAHGITCDNVSQYLVSPPIRKDFRDSWTGEVCALWVVLEELPHSQTSGHLVVFDEISDQFGLAGKPRDLLPVFIGHYGSLAETLNGM
jgi:hypothetical protein